MSKQPDDHEKSYQTGFADGQRILLDQQPKIVDITPTRAAMRRMTAALQEQIERSNQTIRQANAALVSGEIEFLNDNYSGMVPCTLYVLEEALQALIEREEARISRIESGLGDLEEEADGDQHRKQYPGSSKE